MLSRRAPASDLSPVQLESDLGAVRAVPNWFRSRALERREAEFGRSRPKAPDSDYVYEDRPGALYVVMHQVALDVVARDGFKGLVPTAGAYGVLETDGAGRATDQGVLFLPAAPEKSYFAPGPLRVGATCPCEPFHMGLPCECCPHHDFRGAAAGVPARSAPSGSGAAGPLALTDAEVAALLEGWTS